VEPSPTIQRYTVAKMGPRDDTGLLIFETCLTTRQELYDFAKALSDLKLERHLYIKVFNDELTVSTYPDLVNSGFATDSFWDLVGYVSPEGEIKIDTIHAFRRECLSPRVLFGCSNCVTDHSEFPGDPCLFYPRLNYTENDLYAEDWIDELNKRKFPTIGNFKYISPHYTKPLTVSTGRKHYSDPRTPVGIAPFIRISEDHSFEYCEELQERQSASAKTKAKIKHTIKTQCARCTKQEACTLYHGRYNSKQYVLRCGYPETITEEQLQAYYLSKIADINREDLAFVSWKQGELTWKNDRFKLGIRLKACSQKGRELRAVVYHKTYVPHVIETFSIEDAAAYLKEHYKQEHPEWKHCPEYYPLKDKAAALIMMVTEEVYQSLPSHGAFGAGTRWPLLHVQPDRYRENVEAIFYATRGRPSPRWTTQTYTSMFDIYRYYGHQYIHPNARPEESD
jgi:hypothetical protein